MRIGDLHAAERVTILDAQIERQTHEMLLLRVGGDVSHERKILDETARLSLGRVRRTQHAPLRRLQRTRSGHFACLLELTRYACHHAKTRDVRKSREHVRDALTFHFKTFNYPIALFF